MKTLDYDIAVIGGGDSAMEEALFLMRDKPKDLIKPVVKLAD